VLRWGLVAAPLVTLGEGGGEVLDHFVTLYGGCILAEPSRSRKGLAAALGGWKPNPRSRSRET
jgi:hypothetical protein